MVKLAIAGVVLLLLLVGFIAMLPDIVRYMKIRAM